MTRYRMRRTPDQRVQKAVSDYLRKRTTPDAVRQAIFDTGLTREQMQASPVIRPTVAALNEYQRSVNDGAGVFSAGQRLRFILRVTVPMGSGSR